MGRSGSAVQGLRFWVLGVDGSGFETRALH